jgi:hypothetical protein
MTSRAFEFDSPRAAVAPSTRMLLMRNKRKFVSEQSNNNAVFGSLVSPPAPRHNARKPNPVKQNDDDSADDDNEDDDEDDDDDGDDDDDDDGVEKEYGIVLGARVKAAAVSASKRDDDKWMSKKKPNGLVYEDKKKAIAI